MPKGSGKGKGKGAAHVMGKGKGEDHTSLIAAANMCSVAVSGPLASRGMPHCMHLQASLAFDHC